MNERKYAKCSWCGKTIDVTNEDKDFCNICDKYPDIFEMWKHEMTSEKAY